MTLGRKGPGIPRKTLYEVLARTDGACHYCGAEGEELDHVLPVCLGGTHDPDNLVAACYRCNRQKADMTPDEWREWRLDRGMAWPPSSVLDVFREVIRPFSEDHLLLVLAAYKDRYAPLQQLHEKYARDYHRFGQTPRRLDRHRTELLKAVEEHAEGAHAR